MTSFFCRPDPEPDPEKEITPSGGKFGDRLPDEVIIHALRPAGPLYLVFGCWAIIGGFSMLDCVSVPYSNYANLVSSVLDAREVWLVLDMLVQRYDEFGPSDRWFSCLSTQVSFLKQHLDGVSLFVDSCKGSFVTNDGEVPDIPSDYSK